MQAPIGKQKAMARNIKLVVALFAGGTAAKCLIGPTTQLQHIAVLCSAYYADKKARALCEES